MEETFSDSELLLQPLPEELIEDEILPWLPVKSLFQFKSVCKHWYALISTPKFVNSHLFQSPKSLFLGPSSSPSIFYYDSYDPNKPNLPNCLTDASDYITKEVSMGEPIPVGSCNGLVCFNLYGLHYIISNPGTKKSIRFRGPPYRDENDRDLEPIWGFGHVNLCDDYKIVLVFSRSGHYGHRVHLFSRNDHSWSSFYGIEFDQFDFPSAAWDRRAVFVDGHVNWKLSLNGNVAIVGFDLGLEKMKVIPMPKWGSNLGDGKSVSLCVLRDCLCLGRENIDTGIDIWLMKKYGEKGSWVKCFSLPRTMEISELRIGDCQFFGFTKTGKFLMHSEEKLMLVDPNQNSVQYKSVMKSPGHIVPYSRSMILPFIPEAIRKKMSIVHCSPMYELSLSCISVTHTCMNTVIQENGSRHSKKLWSYKFKSRLYIQMTKLIHWTAMHNAHHRIPKKSKIGGMA